MQRDSGKGVGVDARVGAHRGVDHRKNFTAWQNALSFSGVTATGVPEGGGGLSATLLENS